MTQNFDEKLPTPTGTFQQEWLMQVFTTDRRVVRKQSEANYDFFS